MVKKKIKTFIKLALTAGKATPAPPIGPVLGQHGINLMNFCKEYNNRTADKVGLIIPISMTIYEDKTYTFSLKSQPTSILLLKNCILEKSSFDQKKLVIRKISSKQIEEIARYKLEDLNTTDLKKAISIIAGTAKNMKIEIID